MAISIDSSERHSLELQLTKSGECHKQLQNINADKRVCETSKEKLELKVHQQEVEMATLKQENKFLHSQLLSEEKENKKLRGERSELQLSYDCLESHHNKMKVDTARLEEGKKYSDVFNVILGVIFCSYIIVCCCLRCNDRDERVRQRLFLAN